MSIVYANSSSGPSAGGIGWFDYGNLTINPGNELFGLTGTLSDGSTVTFDLKYVMVLGTPRSFVATQPPAFPGANFGTTGYTGIPGKVVLNETSVPFAGVTEFTISNIVMKDASGNLIPNYSVIVADAERTNLGEIWNWQTNGGGWNMLATLGPNPPTLVGLGTSVAIITGNTKVDESAYVLTTQNPTQLVLINTGDFESVQGFAIGFAVTKIKLQKNIGERIDSNDQFLLDIGGTPSDSATTSGSLVNLQSQFANVWAVPTNTYTLSEAMAAGSGSLITDYTRAVTVSNITPNGSVPPVGLMPISFTPALGDDVVYTVFNTITQTFSKRVDKEYANTGEVLTYTVTINNLDNNTVSNVLMTDTTPLGTTYIGNLVVSAPYLGTSPSTGITILSIPPNSFVTISWQVQINTALPITDSIENVATITNLGGNSGNTNIVKTRVRHADLQLAGNFVKSVDKAYATFGDTLTYTLNLNNTGNVPANTIEITDTIPSGTTYIPGSVSVNAPFTGDPTSAVILTAPIPASGTATIVFQVKVQNGAPSVNPVPNTAHVNYSFIVDPTQVPTTAFATSNTVITEVSAAKLIINKNTDKDIAYLNDLITYSFAIQNIGNVSASQTTFTDILPDGLVRQPGSLLVSVPYSTIPPNSIRLTNPIAPNEIVTISFKSKVTSLPILNPLINRGEVVYNFTVNINSPNGVVGRAVSNTVSTTIFRYNFSQEITDLINSIAYEQAALAALANAEGSKIQKIVAMGDVTTQQLLSLNKSVIDMTESLSMLENVLKQKLNSVSCQINGSNF